MDIRNMWAYSGSTDGIESWRTQHSLFGRVDLTVGSGISEDRWYLVCAEWDCSFRLKVNVPPYDNTELVLYRVDNILHQLSVLL